MSADWIKPGAAIAVYRVGRDTAPNLRHTTVATVAAKSFTVHGCLDRFQIATMSTKQNGGYWGTRYVATRPDSDDAAAAAAKDLWLSRRVQALRYLNTRQCDSVERVDEAIQALQEWREVLVQGGAS